ncbi:MAG: hypothetical protein IJS50_04770, partial [Desulfovibrio sp.]|nr:hypothetical protein [Desulfovibrio sp.]
MPFRRQLIWSKRLYFPFLLAFLLCLLTACAKQSPLPQAEQASEGVLLVAFGTSVPEAEVSLRAVDAAFKE